LLTATICLHTFFEGFSIGVQEDKVSLISTALAISLHIWADAFSIGMFYKNKDLFLQKPTC
jgi:zinc transporter ZupT